MAKLSLLVTDRAMANNALDGTARKLAMCVKALDDRLSILCLSCIVFYGSEVMFCFMVVYESHEM
jgi:hypothetical protein